MLYTFALGAISIPKANGCGQYYGSYGSDTDLRLNGQIDGQTDGQTDG